jgi:hypothetical protein
MLAAVKVVAPFHLQRKRGQAWHNHTVSAFQRLNLGNGFQVALFEGGVKEHRLADGLIAPAMESIPHLGGTSGRSTGQAYFGEGQSPTGAVGESEVK